MPDGKLQEKKYEFFLLASLKPLKKRVGSGVRSGSISLRCWSVSAPKYHGSLTLLVNNRSEFNLCLGASLRGVRRRERVGPDAWAGPRVPPAGRHARPPRRLPRARQDLPRVLQVRFLLLCGNVLEPSRHSELSCQILDINHRLNMDVISCRSPVYFGSMPHDVHSCTHWLRPRDPHIPPQSHWDLYTRALLVSKDRRHLFLTPDINCPVSTWLQWRGGEGVRRRSYKDTRAKASLTKCSVADPGSLYRIQGSCFFSHPVCRIQDLGSPIQQQQKRMGEILAVLPFFVGISFKK